MLESEEGGGTALTKFARQAADLTAVFLYKEGLFVRAYNEGADGFIHQVLACKAMRRFVTQVILATIAASKKWLAAPEGRERWQQWFDGGAVAL